MRLGSVARCPERAARSTRGTDCASGSRSPLASCTAMGRAIDWLSAACPGTTWRVVDATTERTLDRSALDASGHTEWAARHVHQGAPAVAER